MLNENPIQCFQQEQTQICQLNQKLDQKNLLIEETDKNRLNKLKGLLLPIQLDDYTLSRFLLGFNMSIKDVAEKIRQDLEWRREQKPNELNQFRFNDILQSGEVLLLDELDKKGYPIIYIRSRLHKTYPMVDGCNYKDFLPFMVEKALKSSERASGIVDMTGMSWRNVDIGLNLEAVQLYNNHYPERLGNVIIFGGNMWFEMIFKIIKHLIDPRTMDRIHYIKTSNELSKFVDLNILPKDCALLIDKSVKN